MKNLIITLSLGLTLVGCSGGGGGGAAAGGSSSGGGSSTIRKIPLLSNTSYGIVLPASKVSSKASYKVQSKAQKSSFATVISFDVSGSPIVGQMCDETTDVYCNVQCDQNTDEFCNANNLCNPSLDPNCVVPENPAESYDVANDPFMCDDATDAGCNVQCTIGDGYQTAGESSHCNANGLCNPAIDPQCAGSLLPPIDSQKVMNGPFDFSLNAVIAGGGGVMQNGQVVGGINSVTQIQLQFNNPYGHAWNDMNNRYEWTLQTDEIGNNVLALDKTVETAPWSATNSRVFSMSSVGEDLYIKVSRDTQNIYFEYSNDGGATYQVAYQLGLTSFDSGTAVIRSVTSNSALPVDCSYNGAAIDCVGQ